MIFQTRIPIYRNHICYFTSQGTTTYFTILPWFRALKFGNELSRPRRLADKNISTFGRHPVAPRPLPLPSRHMATKPCRHKQHLPGTFGSEMELYVLNKEFDSDIQVFMDTQTGRKVIQHYIGSKTDEPPVSVLYQTTGPPHYDPLLPEDAQHAANSVITRVCTAVRKLLKKKPQNY